MEHLRLVPRSGNPILSCLFLAIHLRSSYRVNEDSANFNKLTEHAKTSRFGVRVLRFVPRNLK